MWLKPLTESLSLQQAQLLERRLPQLPDALQQDCLKWRAGFRGEQQFLFQLDPYIKAEWRLFHNLRLPSSVQIDFLILTPAMLYVVEVKNWLGTIEFHSDFHQVRRLYQGEEELFPDPIQQVLRQKQYVQKLLSSVGLHVPIQALVALTHPRSFIQAIGDVAFIQQHVCHATSFAERLLTTTVNQYDVDAVGALFLEQQLPDKSLDLTKYQLRDDDIQRGIFCPTCRQYTMECYRLNAVCRCCGESGIEPLHEALADYVTMYRHRPTNTQLRHWLLVHSRHIVKRLLSKYDHLWPKS